eukprot:1669516-Rhodomonas_salina.1
MLRQRRERGEKPEAKTAEEAGTAEMLRQSRPQMLKTEKRNRGEKRKRGELSEVEAERGPEQAAALGEGARRRSADAAVTGPPQGVTGPPQGVTGPPQ